MNERLKELKHQAFLWCDENIPEQYSYATGYGDAWEEKFAELIVKAVFDKIEDERFEVYQPVKESVMKHFGVE